MGQQEESSTTPTPTLHDGTGAPHIPVNQVSGYLPLHAALSQVYPPPVAQMQTLLSAWPAAAHHVLPNGRIALHIAASQDCTPVVQDLLNVYPEGVQQPTVDARLPLDYAVMGKGSLETIKLLIAAFPQSLERIDAKAQSYLYLAIAHDRSEDIVEHFCTPALLVHRDGLGRTILHHVVTRRKGRYVDLILKKKPELLAVPDDSGQLPLHAAAANTKNVPLAVLERLVQLYPIALQTPCHLGDLPLHKLVAQHPLPQIAAIKLLVDAYPESLRYRHNRMKQWNVPVSSNTRSLTPLEVFHANARFTMELRHYDKARAILLALIDQTLPLHQIVQSHRCFPADIQDQVIRDNAKAATRRDHEGLYAWQVAALKTDLTNASIVYELLRIAPTTLEVKR
jgi:hypothetical protein